MIRLVCECCQYEQEFVDSEAAFQAGWDAPPHFTTCVVCNLCPASLFVMGVSHEPVHQWWRERGRPTEFSQEACVEEKDRADPTRLRELQTLLERLRGARYS